MKEFENVITMLEFIELERTMWQKDKYGDLDADVDAYFVKKNKLETVKGTVPQLSAIIVALRTHEVKEIMRKTDPKAHKELQEDNNKNVPQA